MQTSGGARFLRQQLLRPSADVATIRGRQEASMFFVDHDDVLSGVVGHLRRVPDLDRVLNRLVSLQVADFPQLKEKLIITFFLSTRKESATPALLEVTSRLLLQSSTL